MKRFFIAAAAVFATAACGDSTTEPIQQTHTYDLTVTGDITAELTGRAFFGADTDDEGDEVFAFVMGSDTSTYLLTLARHGSGRPGVGTYEIADQEATDEQWVGVLYATEGDELIDIYLSQAGELSITESSTQRVRGSLEFTAIGMLSGSGQPVEIEVSGTFTAMHVQ